MNLKGEASSHSDTVWTEIRLLQPQRSHQSLFLPSDRLWQHVTSAIMDRDQLRATQEKFVLEEAQRREARERGDKAWAARLFHQDPVTSEWTYRHME